MAKLFLKEWREMRQLTQDALATRVGLSVAVLSRIEQGRAEWTGSQLDALATALGCEPRDLLTPPA